MPDFFGPQPPQPTYHRCRCWHHSGVATSTIACGLLVLTPALGLYLAAVRPVDFLHEQLAWRVESVRILPINVCVSGVVVAMSTLPWRVRAFVSAFYVGVVELIFCVAYTRIARVAALASSIEVICTALAWRVVVFHAAGLCGSLLLRRMLRPCAMIADVALEATAEVDHHVYRALAMEDGSAHEGGGYLSSDQIEPEVPKTPLGSDRLNFHRVPGNVRSVPSWHSNTVSGSTHRLA